MAWTQPEVDCTYEGSRCDLWRYNGKLMRVGFQTRCSRCDKLWTFGLNSWKRDSDGRVLIGQKRPIDWTLTNTRGDRFKNWFKAEWTMYLILIGPMIIYGIVHLVHWLI